MTVHSSSKKIKLTAVYAMCSSHFLRYSGSRIYTHHNSLLHWTLPRIQLDVFLNFTYFYSIFKWFKFMIWISNIKVIINTYWNMFHLLKIQEKRLFDFSNDWDTIILSIITVKCFHTLTISCAVLCCTESILCW